MKKKLNKIILNKKAILISSFVILVLFSVILNIAFSAFTSRNENGVANIKVAGMNYNISVNGVSERKITVTGDKTTTANIVINALNSRDSKYELIYKVCSDASCTEYINKPESLTIEYSSKTIDQVTGAITANGVKQIRIAVTNTSATTYYIELGINAGFSYNTLAEQRLITTEYNEEDIKIAAIIDGELSPTFPTNGDYIATVACALNGGASNATGVATWNGTKWVVNITGIDTGQTTCNVNFDFPINNYVINLSNDTQNTGVKNEKGYRYQGKNSNNWIIFNDEYWRIIGVFDENTHGKTGQNLVKIIKSESIGNYAWASNNLNNWGNSSLRAYLNTEYINGLNISSKSSIEVINWKLGSLLMGDTTSEESYTAERKSPFYTESIGLIYPSDFGYAVPSNFCGNNILGDYYLEKCKNNNWLYNELEEWTLTPFYGPVVDGVYVVSNNGGIQVNALLSGVRNVRPVLYLKSTTPKLSGDGTYENPYIIMK